MTKTTRARLTMWAVLVIGMLLGSGLTLAYALAMNVLHRLSNIEEFLSAVTRAS